MKPLLIFGASTRAAAFSAIRAGFNPICGDLYADADLRKFASVLDASHYPHRLLQAAQGVPSESPWIYTGALENWPGEVALVSERHALWGNSADVLRRCRDPWLVAEALAKAGHLHLELRASDSPPTADSTWLMKPLHSSAGRAITVWTDQTISLNESHYFQRFVPGTPIAAAFLADAAQTYLLGVSQQLIGATDLNVPQFGYCGSIYPCPSLLSPAHLADPAPAVRDLISRIGQTLSREFGLRGLFGIDFIYDDQQVWVTEINPRYTASMELIEYGCQSPLLKWHQEACNGVLADDSLDVSPKSSSYAAKVILYADRAARAPDLTHLISQRIAVDELPQWADIPVAGSEIFPGQPVFTCLGAGPDAIGLLDRLTTHARELWATFPSTIES